MGFYEGLVRQALFMLDPEQVHYLASDMMPLLKAVSPLLGNPFDYQDPLLATQLAGKQLRNPVGIAAGFDKNGHLPEVIGSFGFGFSEIGSVTGSASEGNPKPRLFRLPEDKAIINRMGLNGDGAEVVAARLARKSFSLPTAVNIAKTNDPALHGDAAIADQVSAFDAVRGLPLTYAAINTSCPNTHDGCLQATDELHTLLSAVQKRNDRALPIFLKLSPDSTDELLHDFITVASNNGIRGFICGNTTLDRAGLHTPESQIKAIGNGGLSGAPLKQKALNLVRRVFELKTPNQEIVGCGGVSTGADAVEFIRAGADAVQIYTAFVYRGPSAAAQINREIAKILKQEQTTLSQIKGSSRIKQPS